MSADPGRSGPSRPRAGVPSRLALGVVSVRRTSSSGVWVAMALACVCAHAADPNKVLRIEFYVAETGFEGQILKHPGVPEIAVLGVADAGDYTRQPVRLAGAQIVEDHFANDAIDGDVGADA